MTRVLWSATTTLVLLLVGGAVAAQDDHDHGKLPEKAASQVKGYVPDRPVTRYELAVVLHKMVVNLEAADRQPNLAPKERRSNFPVLPKPDTKKVKPYTDVPKNHWAAASLAALQSRGIVLASGSAFAGEQKITGSAFAAAVEPLAAWIERRKPGKATIEGLIAGKYLNPVTPLKRKTDKVLTAAEVTEALGLVLMRIQEQNVPVSPGSKYDPNDQG